MKKARGGVSDGEREETEGKEEQMDGWAVTG